MAGIDMFVEKRLDKGNDTPQIKRILQKFHLCIHECLQRLFPYRFSQEHAYLFTKPRLQVGGVPSGGGGFYDPFYNVIGINPSFPNVEGALSHEYIHYVLCRLIPTGNAHIEYDNIARIVENW